MSLWRDFLADEFQKKPSRTLGRKQVRNRGPLRKWESRFEESQNYEVAESMEYKKHAVRNHLRAGAGTQQAGYRWALIFLVGFLCAVFGVGIHMLTIFLVTFKNDIVTGYMYSGLWGAAFAMHFSLALAFATLSAAFCSWEPSAAGSGIPETKSFLNGVQLDTFMRLRTLVAKCCSVVFTVSSGLFAGPEGPMVHIGAILGGSLSRWYSRVLLGVGKAGEWASFDSLRVDASDTNTRDFVTYGAAAGIAAAFRAPIGGVLFILEEGASFWSTELTWRTFFCSSITLLTVVIMDRSLHMAGEDMTSNFSFGKFSEVTALTRQEGGGGLHAYLIIELSLFFLVGCIGGLLGGIFVAVNGFFARLRKKYVTTGWRRMVEVLGLVSLTAWMTFTVPLIWSVCSTVPEDSGEGEEGGGFSRDEVYLVQRLVQFDCPSGQYNQVASLFYVDSNTAIKLLFHFREHMSAETFDTGSLVVVLVPYFVLACATCGVAASAGVFVSCLVSGAVMGRLFGHLLHLHFAHKGMSDAGTYALVGAAAMIGGVCRNTMSLTVMMVEATGNLDYVLPLMLALLAAKYVGDLLSPGLYNNLVALRELPWLAETLDSLNVSGGGEGSSTRDLKALHLQPVSQFMASPVVHLREAETVGKVLQTLKETTHHLFPVMEGGVSQTEEVGGRAATGLRLRGAVSRAALLEVLHSGLFCVPLSRVHDDTEEVARKDRAESEGLLLEETLCPVSLPPTAPSPSSSLSSSLESLCLTAHQCSLFVDLRPFLDPAPHIVLEDSSLKKAFALFRTLGLRHLLVVNRLCEVTGVITRKDLIEARLLRHCRRQHRHQRRHRGEGGGNSILLRQSLPSSQQLQPLRLPAASSKHNATSWSGGRRADQKHSWCIGEMGGVLDDSVTSSGSDAIDLSSRGLLQREGHAQSEHRRGKQNALLDFFFPSDNSAISVTDTDASTSGSLTDCTAQGRTGNDTTSGSGGLQLSSYKDWES